MGGRIELKLSGIDYGCFLGNNFVIVISNCLIYLNGVSVLKLSMEQYIKSELQLEPFQFEG